MLENCPLYQSVIVTFSNGQIGYFTGEAVMTEEEAKTIKVNNIKFTLPKKLPMGCSFVEIEQPNNVGTELQKV